MTKAKTAAPAPRAAWQPTYYLYGTVLTGEAVAANNRGETSGNTTTLQKVILGGHEYTTVSSEAIRFALRLRLQMSGTPLNRQFHDDKLSYADEKRASWGGDGCFADDDLFGFMTTEGPRAENEATPPTDAAAVPAAAPAPDAKPGKGDKAPPPKIIKGSATKRTSPLAVSRAVSLRPYRGETSFNCVSGEKKKGELSLYAAEMHATEYQYSFGLNLTDVVKKGRIGELVEAICDPARVGGNHSRFLYDFSPASLVLRLTGAHSPRIISCFERAADGPPSANRLEQLVESGDVPAAEIIVAGDVARRPLGARLKALGATVVPGIAEAARIARERIAALGGDFAEVRP